MGLEKEVTSILDKRKKRKKDKRRINILLVPMTEEERRLESVCNGEMKDSVHRMRLKCWQDISQD